MRKALLGCSFLLEEAEDILFYKPIGLFGEDESVLAINAISEALNKFKVSSFALLIDTSELEGFTANSNHLWMKAIDDWYERGHAALIRIDDSSTINYRVFLESFDTLFAERMPVSVHTTKTEAFAHAKKLGFNPDRLNHLLPPPV